jgi:hypothetical protein
MSRQLPIRHHRPGQSIGASRILIKIVFVPFGPDARNTLSAYFTIGPGTTKAAIMARAAQWLVDFLASNQQSTPLHSPDDYYADFAESLGM